MKMRGTSQTFAAETPHRRQQLSHERVVATLRLRIKTLEARNRDLAEQLEATYGRLAVKSKMGALLHT